MSVGQNIFKIGTSADLTTDDILKKGIMNWFNEIKITKKEQINKYF